MSGVKSNFKRRPRIIAIQKKLLVQLIENHFTRTTGKCSNVNFEALETSAFSRFAPILNSWGPKKTPSEWRSSFYYMRNRIRRSVEMIIQSVASVKENLSELDYKVYSMAPSWFHGPLENRSIELDNDFDKMEEENASNVEPGKGETSGIGGAGFNDYHDGYGDDWLNTGVVDDEANDYLNDDYYTLEPLTTETDVVSNGINESRCEDSLSQNFIAENSRRVLVAHSAEELENYMESSVILSEDEELTALSQSANHVTQSENYDCAAALEDSPSADKTFRGIPSFSESLRAPKRSTKVVQSGRAASVGGKIPELQKERLIQLVQNNFLKAFGRFTGANGANIKAQFWESTAKELNTLGPPRTGIQWRTTFNNIKTSAKSKLADDHNNAGGLVTKPLTRLEEKVLSIYGMDALDGIQDLGEAGFQYNKTVPETHRRVCESTVTSGAFENLSKSPGNEETTLEGPPAPHPEVENLNNVNVIPTEHNHEEAVSHDNDDSLMNETSTQNRSTLRDRNSPHLYPSGSSDNRNVTQKSATASRSVTAADSSSPRESGIGLGDQEINRSDSHSEHRFNFQRASSSSSQLRADSSCRSRELSLSHDSGRISLVSSDGRQRPRGASYDVRGVRRLHVRRRRSNEEIEEITNINQLFSDGGRGSDEEMQNDREPNDSRRGDARGASYDVRGVPRLHVRRARRRSNEGDEEITNINQLFSDGGRGSDEEMQNDREPNDSRRGNARGASYDVRGVPRLHVRRARRRSNEGDEEITNINQLFSDGGRGSDEEMQSDRDRNVSRRGNAASRSRRMNDENADRTVARVERDRSNLRHRFTSFEMVQKSMEAQERFIEDNNRNHSELMYATERNHMEMLNIINATLRTVANVGQQYVSNM